MATAEEHVRRLIRHKGRITFAEFMEAALYGPGGYYTSGEPTGPRGGYYTSPQAHPAFGALLALQLEEMWRLMGSPESFQVVEAGAGTGTLAADILSFAHRLDPSFWLALHYLASDRVQTPGLQQHPEVAGKLAWSQTAGCPVSGVNGCIISNELIDAMPVHRVAMRGGRLQEIFVTLAGDRLTETCDDPSTPGLEAQLTRESARLQEGWEAEVGVAASQWMAQAARSLDRGYIITIDYGDMAERLYAAERSRGTLMCYYRHTPQTDPFSRIGRQDMTAHANFTTLAQAGAAAGAGLVALTTQRAFLQALGIDAFLESMAGLRLDDRERQADLMAMRDLVKPDGLGAFRVLIQAKGAPSKPLAGLGQDPGYMTSLRQRLPSISVPLLDASHIDLMRARYPHLRRQGGRAGLPEELV